MTESQSDMFPLAEQRRDAGIANAEAGQERVSEGWSDRAYRLLTEFLCFRRTEFLTEDFVKWTENRIEQPRDGRAWGPVMQRASRKGLIRCVGYAPARSSNLSPKCNWQAKE